MERNVGVAIATGAVAAATGFSGTAAVVLGGLTAAGATPGQAAAGLIGLCITQGAGTLALSVRYRMPITLAWSTPGAALLVTAGPSVADWPASVGAFAAAAVMVAGIAASARLSRWVASIPVPVAQAMLAGILLPICLEPVRVFGTLPWATGAAVVVWLILTRFVPRWATPAVFLLAAGSVAVLVVNAKASVPIPAPVLTAPAWTGPALLGVALPLVVVTMAGQNIPGAVVLAARGYTVPWRPTLLVTAAGSFVGAFAGGPGINLAAITAALPASEQAHPDPGRRWIASATCGAIYLGLGALAPLLAAVLTGPAAGLMQVVAGLALLGPFAAALRAAFATAAGLLPAGATLVVGASSFALLGIGPALWALLVGIAVWVVLDVRRAPDARQRA